TRFSVAGGVEYCRRVVLDDPEQDAGGAFRLPLAGFPAFERAFRKPEGCGELVLRHPQSPADRLDIHLPWYMHAVNHEAVAAALGVFQGLLCAAHDAVECVFVHSVYLLNACFICTATVA